MDYMKNAEIVNVDGGQLHFIRCDKDGRELSPEALAGMNFTNATIDRLVTETAGRLGADISFDGSFTDGIVTE